jgi:hypothetical protein
MSVMNYAYQVYGIETTGGTKLDYARIEIAPVDEQPQPAREVACDGGGCLQHASDGFAPRSARSGWL